MWVRRDGLSFYLGTCPALSEAGLPSSSPSGCRLFSRWFHRVHPPSPGPLREKAAFCTDPGWGWQILVIWNLAPNVQTLVPLSGDREGPQNHSLWELGGFPRDCGHPLGAVEPRKGVKAAGGSRATSTLWGRAGSPAGSDALLPGPGRGGGGNSKARAAWLRLTGRLRAGRTS